MRHPRSLPLLLACALLVGCPFGAAQAPRPLAPAASVEVARMQGRVAFPAREVAATPVDVARRATVSVIDASQQTVAATLTDADGAFSLALGFAPAAGSYYVVEAIKPLTGDDSGGRVVRLRTLVQWTGSAWTSCTGGAIALTPATTAVCVIKATQPTLGYPETMGVVANEAVVSTHPTLNASWASVKTLVASLLARDLDPLAGILLQGADYVLASEQSALFHPNLAQGTFGGTWQLLDGSVQLAGSLPRPGSADDLSFVATGSLYASVIATDGTYLYLKRWPSGTTAWMRVGSGYGATTRGATYSSLVNATSQTVSGAYDVIGGVGYLVQPKYSPGETNTLELVRTSNSAVSTTSVSPSLLFREMAQSTGGIWTLLASDGDYFYNGASNEGKTGFVLRIYDPSNNFAFVRQMNLDGAGTPLAGIGYPNHNTCFMADGVYAYAMEWIANHDGNGVSGIYNGSARMRRYRLSDGQLEAETSFRQQTPMDDPLTGCFDPVNNKFWFATYQKEIIHRTPGRSFPAAGTWVSTPIDLGGTAPLYGRLNFSAVTTQAGQAVRFRIRSANDANSLASATWYGPTGAGDYYTTSGTAVNPVHQRNRWAQIQATLTASTDSVTVANTTPRLYGVSLEAVP